MIEGRLWAALSSFPSACLRSHPGLFVARAGRPLATPPDCASVRFAKGKTIPSLHPSALHPASRWRRRLADRLEDHRWREHQLPLGGRSVHILGKSERLSPPESHQPPGGPIARWPFSRNLPRSRRLRHHPQEQPRPAKAGRGCFTFQLAVVAQSDADDMMVGGHQVSVMTGPCRRLHRRHRARRFRPSRPPPGTRGFWPC